MSPVMLLHRLHEDEDVIQVDADYTLGDQILDISFIMVWKVAGLLVRPKNMTKGSNSPRFVWNAASTHHLPSRGHCCIPTGHPAW